MSNAYAYPSSSRYAGLTCISGYVTVVGVVVIRDGRGFSVTKVGTGRYRITPDDKYYVKGGKMPLIAFCDVGVISGNFPIPASDCRSILVDKTNGTGEFVASFLDDTGAAADPVYGFTFTLFLSDTTASGDA